jgi:hypothetical protein
LHDFFGFGRIFDDADGDAKDKSLVAINKYREGIVVPTRPYKQLARNSDAGHELNNTTRPAEIAPDTSSGKNCPSRLDTLMELRVNHAFAAKGIAQTTSEPDRFLCPGPRRKCYACQNHSCHEQKCPRLLPESTGKKVHIPDELSEYKTISVPRSRRFRTTRNRCAG